jgi:hypothetical protein
VAFGVGAGPVGNLAAEAATQLIQPEGYIRAVLSVDVAMEPTMFR